MNITFPLLLLVFGGLTFWLLSESSLKWYLKVACISAFCFFTIVFWGTIHSFLGWPAKEGDLPEKINIHWVIVKEPNKLSGFLGQIYFIIDSSEESRMNSFLRFFGYKHSKVEPREFGLPYSRKLHEQINNEILPRLKNGQVVRGKMEKGGGKDGFGKGKGKISGEGKKGYVGESQDQEWVFHNLRPGEIQQKDPFPLLLR